MSVAALLLSVVAVVVTCWIAVTPGIALAKNQDEDAQHYLRLMVSSRLNSPLAAKSYTQLNSDADHFSIVLSNVWKALHYSDSDSDRARIHSGSVTPLGEGKYKVCFSHLKVEIFGGHCVEAARFEFGTHNLLQRFTIDHLPLDSVVGPEKQDIKLSKDDTGPADVYSYGSLRDTKANETVSVLWLKRRPTADRDSFTISFRNVIAQDESEHDVTILEYQFPIQLSSRQTGYAVVRTTNAAVFLNICWDGVPSPALQCEWTYGLT